MNIKFNLINLILLPVIFMTVTSYASQADLSGIWLDKSRAILYEINNTNGDPVVDKLYTINRKYCISDTANTKNLKHKFSEASRIDVAGGIMMFYELPTNYPDKPRKLLKLNQLPSKCHPPLESSDPALNFRVLWDFFYNYYPSFNERLSSGYASWRDLYLKYSRQITASMSPRELFQLMGKMLAELHDQHIDLYFEGNPDDGLDVNNNTRPDVAKFNQAFAASYGITTDSDSYQATLAKSILNSFNTIDTQYLEQGMYGPELSLSSEEFPAQPVYTWGMIRNTRIGYLRILQELHFSNESMPTKIAQYNQATKTIDQLIEFFRKQNIDKLIIDNRINFGGEGAINDYLIQYLITDKRIVYKTQEIIDAIPQAIQDFYLQPNDHPLRTKNNLFQIIVLTSNFTVSAGEDLTMQLKALDNVMQLGYRSNGVFASTHTRMLPNGWIFQLPFDRNMSFDGQYYEGSGILPDIEYDPADNYLMKEYNESRTDIFLKRILSQF